MVADFGKPASIFKIKYLGANQNTFFGSRFCKISGDECPVTGKPTEDWELPDPAGRSVDEVQEVAVRIAARMAKLLKELGVPAWAGA